MKTPIGESEILSQEFFPGLLIGGDLPGTALD
jgi:hypothetical protein